MCTLINRTHPFFINRPTADGWRTKRRASFIKKKKKGKPTPTSRESKMERGKPASLESVLRLVHLLEDPEKRRGRKTSFSRIRASDLLDFQLYLNVTEAEARALIFQAPALAAPWAQKWGGASPIFHSRVRRAAAAQRRVPSRRRRSAGAMFAVIPFSWIWSWVDLISVVPPVEIPFFLFVFLMDLISSWFDLVWPLVEDRQAVSGRCHGYESINFCKVLLHAGDVPNGVPLLSHQKQTGT